MGCYGIGSGRVLASIIEQNHDDKGIIWPKEIAPYEVGIVLLDKEYEDAAYLLLKQQGAKVKKIGTK